MQPKGTRKMRNKSGRITDGIMQRTSQNTHPIMASVVGKRSDDNMRKCELCDKEIEMLSPYSICPKCTAQVEPALTDLDAAEKMKQQIRKREDADDYLFRSMN